MTNLTEYFINERKPNLTIVVNTSIDKLHRTIDMISLDHALSFISLDMEISKLFINKQQNDYPGKIIDWISKKISGSQEDIILLFNIDILFVPEFKLDPLIIFKQISRNKHLLVFWPGEYKNNKLSYAIPEHAHYRNWESSGIEVIKI